MTASGASGSKLQIRISQTVLQLGEKQESLYLWACKAHWDIVLCLNIYIYTNFFLWWGEWWSQVKSRMKANLCSILFCCHEHEWCFEWIIEMILLFKKNIWFHFKGLENVLSQSAPQWKQCSSTWIHFYTHIFLCLCFSLLSVIWSGELFSYAGRAT